MKFIDMCSMSHGKVPGPSWHHAGVSHHYARPQSRWLQEASATSVQGPPDAQRLAVLESPLSRGTRTRPGLPRGAGWESGPLRSRGERALRVTRATFIPTA